MDSPYVAHTGVLYPKIVGLFTLVEIQYLDCNDKRKETNFNISSFSVIIVIKILDVKKMNLFILGPIF